MPSAETDEEVNTEKGSTDSNLNRLDFHTRSSPIAQTPPHTQAGFPLRSTRLQVGSWKFPLHVASASRDALNCIYHRYPKEECLL